MSKKPTWQDVLRAADREIEEESELCLDYCANFGQQFDGVKHLSHFRKEIALELIDTRAKYEDVIYPEKIAHG